MVPLLLRAPVQRTKIGYLPQLLAETMKEAGLSFRWGKFYTEEQYEDKRWRIKEYEREKWLKKERKAEKIALKKQGAWRNGRRRV